MDGVLKITDKEFAPGEKKAVWLEVCPDYDGPVKIPLLAANGIKPGKRLYVVNGLYGDEYTGMEAIYKLFQELDPQNMTGAFLGIPMLNTPAFDLIKRTGPDEIIMNRIGAGKSDGFLTEKITNFFMDHIVSQADYGVEIIEIGIHYAITSFVSLVEKPDGSMDLDYAKAYGSNLLWVGSASPTVMRSAAAQKGVNVFMTELGGEAKVAKENVEFELGGLRNLVKHLGIISGEPMSLPERYTTYDGFWMHCHCGGIFRSQLELRQEVKKGENLAAIHDLLDRELEVIRAPHDGIIIGFRTTARIHPGDWTVWVGRIID